MKAVLKTHILMVLTLALPLQTLHGMSQIKQHPLIFGGGAALLAYVAYKAWPKNDDKIPKLDAVEKVMNERVTQFLEMLWVLDNPTVYKELYDSNSIIYKIFKKFIDDYSQSWWDMIISPDKRIMSNIEFLKRDVKGDKQNQQNIREYNKIVDDLKQNIRDIRSLITNFINTHVHQSLFTRTIKAISRSTHVDKILSTTLKGTITDLIKQVNKLNENIKSIRNELIRLSPEPSVSAPAARPVSIQNTLQALGSTNLQTTIALAEQKNLPFTDVLLGQVVPKIRTLYAQYTEEQQKVPMPKNPSFIDILKEALGDKMKELRELFKVTTGIMGPQLYL